MTGLVLEGGGVRGSYQVGAYLALKECKINFDGIVGTSIGSFNAAMLVINKEKELKEFWESLDVAKILGIDPDFAEIIVKKTKPFKLLEGVAGIVKQGGLKTKGMYEALDSLFEESEVRSSKIDYGLVTVRMNGFKPVEIFKEDIPEGKLKDYIVASCYLPVFKYEKIIDDNLYIDGGAFNNLPISMLAEKNYDTIYAIRLNKYSIYKRVKNSKGQKIIIISPTKDLGSILALDKKIRIRNLKMGYMDAMKMLKNYDGDEFYFRQKGDFYYNLLARKIPKQELWRVKNFFNTEGNKEVIIKAIEYVLKREEIADLELYKIGKLLKEIKKKFTNDHFIYNFVRNLKLL